MSPMKSVTLHLVTASRTSGLVTTQMEERFPQEVYADPMSTLFLLRTAAGGFLSLGQKESRYLSGSGYGYPDRARLSLLHVLLWESGDVRPQSKPFGAHRDSNRPASPFSWQDPQGGAYS